jgi:succinyl-CoA synthetase beta subunit
MKLVTPQTGPEGRMVRRLLIEEGLDIKRELYLSILVDRAAEAPVFMASAAGGMEIEEVAQGASGAILRETIRSGDGIAGVSSAEAGFRAGAGRRRW